jgi:hypothetical protein
MSRPRERSTTSSLVAVAAMLAGCSKGAAPSTAPAVDAGVAPTADGGADTSIHVPPARTREDAGGRAVLA